MDYSAKAGSRPPLTLQYIIAAVAAAVFVARDSLSSGLHSVYTFAINRLQISLCAETLIIWGSPALPFPYRLLAFSSLFLASSPGFLYSLVNILSSIIHAFALGLPSSVPPLSSFPYTTSPQPIDSGIFPLYIYPYLCSYPARVGVATAPTDSCHQSLVALLCSTSYYHVDSILV